MAEKTKTKVPRILTNKEVSEITGLNPKTIGYYSNRGFIEPSVSKGSGRGGNRLYSVDDVLKFMLTPILSEHKLSLEKIGKVFDLLKKDLFNSSSPHLYHGSPHNRVFLGVYNISTDNLSAQVVFIPDPERVEDPENRANLEENLRTFTVDMNSNKSVLVIDITDCIRKLG